MKNQRTKSQSGYLRQKRLGNRIVLRIRLKESGGTVWGGDEGRLFQDVGPLYGKARCPAEDNVTLWDFVQESVRGEHMISFSHKYAAVAIMLC